MENEINLTLVAGDVSPRVLSAPSCHDWTFEVRPQPTSLSPCEHRAGREPERGAARTAHLRSSPLTPSAPISANQRFVSSALRPLPSDLECSMSNVECSPSSTLSLRCQGNESQGNPAQSVRTGLNPIPLTSIPLTCGPVSHPLPLALQATRGERAGERGRQNRSSPLIPSAPISANQRFVSSVPFAFSAFSAVKTHWAQKSRSQKSEARCQRAETRNRTASSHYSALNCSANPSLASNDQKEHKVRFLPLALPATCGERAGERGGQNR